MGLAEKIQKDLTDAMKARDEVRLSVLRMVKSALKHKEVEKIRPLEEGEAGKGVVTPVKERKEAIEQFGERGRQDLVEKGEKELAIPEAYLPSAARKAEMETGI